MKNIYIAIHDVDKDVLQDPDPRHFKFLNDKGYGIFKTVNMFKKKRTVDNVCSLDYFYADLDGGDKEYQIKLLKKCPRPTSLVESKNGFHVYWKISTNMIEKYGKQLAIDYYLFIEALIVNCLKADQGAKDIARVLRVPGFFHQKDPSDPFMVKEVFRSNTVVKPEHMMSFFKSGYIAGNKSFKGSGVEFGFSKSSPISFMGTSYQSIWDKVSVMNQMDLLALISGSSMVNGEVYDFSPIASTGKHFVYVNGKKISGAWIDVDGKIGSHCDGGPTVIQWLSYFNHKKSEIALFLEDILNGKS